MINEATKRFILLVPLMVPDLIGDNDPDEIITRDGYCILSYNLEQQREIDDVLDIIENEMELTVLYNAVSKVNMLNKQCCAFSHPAGENLYKINIVTNRYGMVDSLTATIYTSLEQMASELQDDARLHRQSYECSEILDSVQLLACFQ